jgi:exoribonuclease R
MSANTYKTIIEKRDYSEWKFIPHSESSVSDSDSDSIEKMNIASPLSLRIFHDDVFIYENPCIIVKSPVRHAKEIAGILLLENNRTYGRSSKSSMEAAAAPTKKSRLYYKCIPDNPHLPAFLIPYEISVGFSKKFVNKYVTFRYKEWTIEQQHPVGTLVETIGDVTHLPSYCEYRLCARDLRYSISAFTKHVKSQINEKRTSIENIMNDPKFNIHDLTAKSTDNHIIAIDPEGSRDFDDALSANILPNQGYSVSIHIANVFVWLESLNLWDLLTDSCASIYLPDKRRHMLPPILSNDLCILNSYEEKRIAFTAILTLDENANIIGVDFKNTAIKIAKNYVYETAECLADPAYKLLHKLAKMQNVNICDSHDVVAHWMIKMNEICGDKLAKSGAGIFRKTSPISEQNGSQKADSVDKTLTESLTINTRKMLQSWLTHFAAEYVTTTDAKHEIMQTQNYAHITSPIRRLVDILNQMWLIWQLGLVEKANCTENSHRFLERNLENLANINKKMRAIKNTQQECETLYKISDNPEIQDQTHRGFIIDITPDKITAYVEELNIIISVSNLKEISVSTLLYSYRDFRVFVFEDEYKIKQKLRWTIL